MNRREAIRGTRPALACAVLLACLGSGCAKQVSLPYAQEGVTRSPWYRLELVNETSGDLVLVSDTEPGLLTVAHGSSFILEFRVAETTSGGRSLEPGLGRPYVNSRQGIDTATIDYRDGQDHPCEVTIILRNAAWMQDPPPGNSEVNPLILPVVELGDADLLKRTWFSQGPSTP